MVKDKTKICIHFMLVNGNLPSISNVYSCLFYVIVSHGKQTEKILVHTF